MGDDQDRVASVEAGEDMDALQWFFATDLVSKLDDIAEVLCLEDATPVDSERGSVEEGEVRALVEEVLLAGPHGELAQRLAREPTERRVLLCKLVQSTRFAIRVSGQYAPERILGLPREPVPFWTDLLLGAWRGLPNNYLRILYARSGSGT